MRHLVYFLMFSLLSVNLSAHAQESLPTPTVTPTPTPTPTATPVTRCKNTVPLDKFRDGGILYKPENEHGGRGATLLIQNFKYWYGPSRKSIYDSKCIKRIGTVRKWSLGFPYGERYYSKLRGASGDNGASLAAKALKATRRRGGIVIINKSFFREHPGFP